MMPESKMRIPQSREPMRYRTATGTAKVAAWLAKAPWTTDLLMASRSSSIVRMRPTTATSATWPPMHSTIRFLLAVPLAPDASSSPQGRVAGP
jgi:hypothetical protein